MYERSLMLQRGVTWVLELAKYISEYINLLNDTPQLHIRMQAGRSTAVCKLSLLATTIFCELCERPLPTYCWPQAPTRPSGQPRWTRNAFFFLREITLMPATESSYKHNSQKIASKEFPCLLSILLKYNHTVGTSTK